MVEEWAKNSNWFAVYLLVLHFQYDYGDSTFHLEGSKFYQISRSQKVENRAVRQVLLFTTI
jgi:hypothetical protein